MSSVVPAPDPAAWAERVRDTIGRSRNVCRCGQPLEPGRTSCPACLVAQATAARCLDCDGPLTSGNRAACAACARSGAKQLAGFIRNGLLRADDWRTPQDRRRVAAEDPTPRPGESHLEALKRSRRASRRGQSWEADRA